MNELLLQQAGSPSLIAQLWPLALIMVVFYFFIIRPQSKRQKEQKQFNETMEKGDSVVTTSGILGKINKIEEDIITLEVTNKVFIQVLKTAVSKEMTANLYDKKSEK